MLDIIRTALRLKSHAYDSEISSLIAACLADLRIAGVVVPDFQDYSVTSTGDPLLDRAVILYAKANFGYNTDSERLNTAYEHLKCSLCLAGDYNGLG